MKDTQRSSQRPGRVMRWMYRSGGPNRLAKGINRIGALIASAGLMPRRLVTLEIRGRRSGRLISLPLVPADYLGESYLVAMLGPGTDWVSNIRAAGGRATLRSGERRPVRLEEIEPSLRGPILQRYLQLAPGARPHIPVDRHAALTEFDKISARYPVFRIIDDPAA